MIIKFSISLRIILDFKGHLRLEYYSGFWIWTPLPKWLHVFPSRPEELDHLSKVTKFCNEPCEVSQRVLSVVSEQFSCWQKTRLLCQKDLFDQTTVSFWIFHIFQAITVHSFHNPFLSGLINNCHITTLGLPRPTSCRVLNLASVLIVHSLTLR